jgi:hypothetical protein
MPAPLVYGDAAEIVTLSGTALQWTIWDAHPTTHYAPYQVTAQVVVAPTQDDYAVFRIPEMYNLYPEIVRYMDTTYVNRDSIPLYYWDGGIRWDMEPAQWDAILAPEPILKTTTRIMQMELEKTAHEIEDLLELYDLKKCPKSALPYHAALMGTPLPAAREEQQRVFLELLGDTYRNKGTPASFNRLFERLGFTLTLQENYQRKQDAAFVGGPQIANTSTNLVQDEPIGTTSATDLTYEFQFLFTPIARGSILVRIYEDSTVEPTIIKDNGEGGWSEGYAGTINYTTGSATLTLPSAPALVGQPVEADYRYLVDAFPDPHENRWTDRWRSSVVYVGLKPMDSSIQLTTELNNRLLLYLDLLKPAHVVVRGLTVIFEFEEDESANSSEELGVFSYLHMASHFGSLYLGAGWAATDNASLQTDPLYVGVQHRVDGEYITRYDNAPHSGSVVGQDLTREPPPPYVYPWKMDGRFTNFYPAGTAVTNVGFGISAVSGQRATLDSSVTDLTSGLSLGEYFTLDGHTNAGNNGTWKVVYAPAGVGPWTAAAEKLGSVPPVNEAAGASVTMTRDAFSRENVWTAPTAPTLGRLATTVTTDIAPLVSTCSILKGAGTTLGIGDYIVFKTGAAGGESRILTAITDNGTYYTVAWVGDNLPVAPALADEVVLLDVRGANLNNLAEGLREQDPLEIDFGQDMLAGGIPPDGLQVGPFITTVTAAHRPVLGRATLRFTIGATTYEEYAEATGAFTNVSTHIAASAIDYATGVTSVTFGTAPDALTRVELLTYTAASKALGEY